MHAVTLAQWAHDIRNTLGTVTLYLETLERPSEPETIRVVALTNALIAKAAGMCNDAIRDAAAKHHEPQRQRFDVMRTIAQVIDLVRPIAPASTKLRVHGRGPAMAVADPQDVFRILFNLIHNAVSVARQSDRIRQIDLFVEMKRSSATISVVDDGPGLPERVRSNLFRRGTSTTGGTGYGLSIARELAERNGGMLELSQSGAGTCFTLELQCDWTEPGQSLADPRGVWIFQPSFA